MATRAHGHTTNTLLWISRGPRSQRLSRDGTGREHEPSIEMSPYVLAGRFFFLPCPPSPVDDGESFNNLWDLKELVSTLVRRHLVNKKFSPVLLN
jgi:hypothetical protein